VLASAGGLVGPFSARFSDVLQYERALPVPAGMYYVVIDNTSSAGLVSPPAPAFGAVGDVPAVVRYAVQTGDVP